MCELRASGWGRVWVGAGTLAAARAWRGHSMGYGRERTPGSRVKAHPLPAQSCHVTGFGIMSPLCSHKSGHVLTR